MKHLKVFENFTAFENAKTLYRWVGQAGLFIYFYGDMPGEKMAPYLFGGKPTNNLPLSLEMQPSHSVTDENRQGKIGDSICMTIDPNYMGEPYSGDSIIRVNFDFEKMRRELDVNLFEDLTSNGEAEVRYHGSIPNWMNYVTKIDIEKEYFLEGVEDDFGEWSPIISWFPEKYQRFVKTFRSEKDLISKDKTFDKNKLRR